MQEEGGGLVVRGRVEIDMRPPFRSVKEAVMLFGEKVLAGEIYAKKLNEMQTKVTCEGQNQKQSKFEVVTAELEETKQSLENSKQEGNHMARHLNFLMQELEQTKMELHLLKSNRQTAISRPRSLFDQPEIEEIKFVESANKVEPEDDELIQNKRSVKFANPPLLTQVIVNGDEEDVDKKKVQKNRKTKTKTKKPLIPVIGRLFWKGEQRQ